MPHPLVMPKPGQMTESCSIIRWLKKEGDPVAKGDIVFEIETDKAAMEVESFFEGTLLKILVREGQTVPVQTVVGFVGRPGEAVPEVPRFQFPVRDAKADATRSSPAASPAGKAPIPVTPPDSAAATQAAEPGIRSHERETRSEKPGTVRISPRAARLARESVIDPSGIAGSGPGGRVVEKDVKAYLQAKGYGAIRVTATAKVLAVKERVDLLTVQGTGVGGRITAEDVRRSIDERPRPMSRMRQVIAERLTRSVTTAPHFFVTVAVDMTDLAARRSELKKEGREYSFNDYILKASAAALREFPDVNSSTDGRSVRWSSRIHLGMAVNVPGGLVVPVVRDAGELSLAEVHDHAAALAAKAREGKLAPDEMAGSTFTISNMGMMDVENFTAIINPGEGAILAISSIRPLPAVRDGRVVVRSIMKITLSADHRLIDGALAARFVNAVKSRLEDPKQIER